MKWFAPCCVLLILTACAEAVHAQTTVKWGLKDGTVFFVRQTRKSEQILKVQDSLIRQDLTATGLYELKVLQQTDSGLVLQQKIDTLTTSGETEKSGTKEFLKGFQGAAFTFHLDPNFRITKMEGYAELVQKLAKGDAGLEKTIRAVLPELEFREVVEQLFDFVPGKPLDKGTTWTSEATEPFGPMGVFKISNHWSFAGKVEPDGIKILGTQKILLDTAQAAKTLPFQIKAGIVKKADAKVEIVFDTAKGKLQKRTFNRQLHLQFLIEMEKRSLDMHLEQTSSMTLEVLDKHPGKK